MYFFLFSWTQLDVTFHLLQLTWYLLNTCLLNYSNILINFHLYWIYIDFIDFLQQFGIHALYYVLWRTNYLEKFLFYFQIIDKISDDDYDYRIIYCATNKGGFRLGRMQYCIFESEIISPLRPPKNSKLWLIVVVRRLLFLKRWLLKN